MALIRSSRLPNDTIDLIEDILAGSRDDWKKRYKRVISELQYYLETLFWQDQLMEYGSFLLNQQAFEYWTVRDMELLLR